MKQIFKSIGAGVFYTLLLHGLFWVPELIPADFSAFFGFVYMGVLLLLLFLVYFFLRSRVYDRWLFRGSFFLSSLPVFYLLLRLADQSENFVEGVSILSVGFLLGFLTAGLFLADLLAELISYVRRYLRSRSA